MDETQSHLPREELVEQNDSSSRVDGVLAGIDTPDEQVSSRQPRIGIVVKSVEKLCSS